MLNKVEFALFSVRPDLDAARQLLEDHHHAYPYRDSGAGANGASTGLLGDSLDPNNNNNNNNTNGIHNNGVNAAATTGGYCNTNHQVVLTGDPMLDRWNELKRNYQQRQRSMVPETKGTERWDKPQRIPGQRRRRIVREVDVNPNAPADPPPSGYIIFVGQMTCKRRHDHPDQPHHQPTVMQDIARVWKDEMSDSDRQHYLDFAKEAQAEYGQQQMEYRATGFCTASRTYCRLGGNGPWVRKHSQDQNGLEREISAYPSVHFPLRPPSHNEDYIRREWRSKVSRKLKDKGILENMGRYCSAHEQTIIAQAVEHARELMVDAFGLDCGSGNTSNDNNNNNKDGTNNNNSVNHVKLVNAATDEAMAKLLEYKEAQKALDEHDIFVEPDPQCLIDGQSTHVAI